MDYNININKICRVCLEEGVLTSIFNTEFAMQPAEMITLCARIRVYRDDGLPPVICNNCIYRLGAAYHFKQQCENNDLRLRSYLGILEKGFSTRDNETNTDPLRLRPEMCTQPQINKNNDLLLEFPSSDSETTVLQAASNVKRKSRYVRKTPGERKKRGPKPQAARPPATCYECHKTFKCPAQLELHIRTHTGDRPFACPHCDRRFAQKHNLAIHVRTHTGERPFQCEICSRQFAALGNFQAHKKIHTGVRDQLCPVCQKAFVTGGDLARHMQTHTGLKNHHCDVCGKSFTRNRDMQAHKRKMHAQQQSNVMQLSGNVVGPDDAPAVAHHTFKCRQCHKPFNSAICLGAHERSAHVTDPTDPRSAALMMSSLNPSASTTIDNTVSDMVMPEIDVGTQQQLLSDHTSVQQQHHLQHHPSVPILSHHLQHHHHQPPASTVGNESTTLMHHHSHLNHHSVQHVHPHLNHVASMVVQHTNHPLAPTPQHHYHSSHLPSAQRLHPF